MRSKLIILTGICGAGKTHYANKYIEQNEEHEKIVRLSSDAIREELYGDESIQGNPSEVFNIMQSRALEALDKGCTVLYDATNMTRKDRAHIISACPPDTHIACHIVWSPIEICMERDAARERTVGKAVIDKMLKRFQPPWYDEGINEIRRIDGADIDICEYTEKYMESMKIDHENPHHTLNIYDHCMRAYDHALGNGYIEDVVTAAKYHDIGKPYVKDFHNHDGEVTDVAHYYQHQNVSAWISYGLVGCSIRTAWLIGVHMDPFMDTKYYRQLPKYLKDLVDNLHKADLDAH